MLKTGYRFRLLTAGLLLLTLVACGAKPPAATQAKPAERVSGGRSGVFVVDTLVQNSADARKTRRAALMGVFVSHFLSTSPTAVVNGGIQGIQVQTAIFDKQSTVSDPDFDLIQAFADALQVDVLDLLNRSLDRQATLDVYVSSLDNIAQRANTRLAELKAADDTQTADLRQLNHDRADLDRELRNATSDKDYLLANEKQKSLNEKERQISDASLKLDQIKNVSQTLEDLMKLYGDKSLAIQENREPLIAGTKVVDLPGTLDLKILEKRGGSSGGSTGGSTFRSNSTTGGTTGGASTGGSTGGSSGGNGTAASSSSKPASSIFGNPFGSFSKSSSSSGGASTGGSTGGTTGGGNGSSSSRSGTSAFGTTGGSTAGTTTSGSNGGSTGGTTATSSSSHNSATSGTTSSSSSKPASSIFGNPFGSFSGNSSSSGGGTTAGTTNGGGTTGGGTTGGTTTGGGNTTGGTGVAGAAATGAGAGGGVIDVGALLEGGNGSINELVSIVIALLLIAGLFLCLIYLVWGGIKYITSAGNEESIKKAGATIRYALLGLVVCLLGYFIVWWLAILLDAPFDLSFSHILDLMSQLYQHFSQPLE